MEKITPNDALLAKWEALEVSYNEKLRQYLRKECTTLETAKAWIKTWANEGGQWVPNLPEDTDAFLNGSGELGTLTEQSLDPTDINRGAAHRNTRVIMSVSKMANILSCALENREITSKMKSVRQNTLHGWELYLCAAQMEMARPS